MPLDIHDDQLLANVLAKIESKPQASAVELTSLLYQLATVVRNTRMGVSESARSATFHAPTSEMRWSSYPKIMADRMARRLNVPGGGHEIDRNLVDEQARLIRELTGKLDRVLSTVCVAMGQSVHAGVAAGLDQSLTALLSAFYTNRDRLAGLQREYKEAVGILQVATGRDEQDEICELASCAALAISSLRAQLDRKIDALRAVTIAERAITLAAKIDASDAVLQDLLILVGELRAVNNAAAERVCKVVCREPADPVRG